MIRKINTFCLALLTLSIFIFAACESGTSQDKNKLDADTFEKQLQASPNGQLIDVRTPEEFKNGHLKGAVNLNYNDPDFASEINKLDKSKPAFVYCLSGGRSSSAAAEMRKAGFSQVLELKGGITQWNANKKTVITDETAPVSMGISQEEYIKLITSDNFVLVDIGAKWCMPCRKLSPILDEIAIEKKDILTLVKLDADENKGIMQSMQIEFLPTLYLYKGGNLVWESTGFVEKSQILSHLIP